jgi:hypothetical protein
MSNRVDVIIVGAGMAGLAAAAELGKRNVTSIVLDKGRAPGGRMATRRIQDASFDHGAQHFSARSEEFRRQTADWIERGLVRRWFSSKSRTMAGQPVEPRHIGTAGMRRIPEYVASDLRVETSVTVERIEYAVGGVAAVSSEGEAWHASGVIVTPPAPQALQLLRRSALRMSATVENMLAATEYDACLAVMARLDGTAGLPDGHVALSSGPIAWMADNQHKGISAVPAVTIHSAPEYADRNLDTDPAVWVAALVESAQPHLAGSIVDATGHRWRYSQPRTTFDNGAVAVGEQAPLILAGELFAGARVEGAFRSGLAAAELMESML